MIRVLLVDDEPLVLIGMQSMLDWNALGYELVGTARNGAEALERIGEQQPDVVVSDIRMPVLDGLQLASRSREQYGALPVFIMLTSYEEFDYVRRSMGLGAVDYLVKIDLTPENLTAALDRARTAVEKERALRAPAQAAPGGLESYRDRFFIQLYSGLFPTDGEIRARAGELGLTLDAPAYAVAIADIHNRELTPDQQVTLSTGVTRMAADILSKYLPCHVTGMDLRHFSVLLPLQSRDVVLRQHTLPHLNAYLRHVLHNGRQIGVRVVDGDDAPGANIAVKPTVRLLEKFPPHVRVHEQRVLGAPVVVGEDHIRLQTVNEQLHIAQPVLGDVFNELAHLVGVLVEIRQRVLEAH